MALSSETMEWILWHPRGLLIGPLFGVRPRRAGEWEWHGAAGPFRGENALHLLGRGPAVLYLWYFNWGSVIGEK